MMSPMRLRALLAGLMMTGVLMGIAPVGEAAIHCQPVDKTDGGTDIGATVDVSQRRFRDDDTGSRVSIIGMGQSVLWTVNTGCHTVTAGYDKQIGNHNCDGNQFKQLGCDVLFPTDSDFLSAPSSYVQTFETPGIFSYFCKPHQGADMRGVVIVTA
ncbi:MAG: plastocyanin/azurin family copper-binding protein [Thermoplasmatota archaeon]